MKDIEVILPNKPGMLALLGDTLGGRGISLEGGGVFANGEIAIAHFLVEDAENALQLLSAPPFISAKINHVLMLRLRQDVPGQLGAFCRKMADASVNILVQYSDHTGQLIVVPDDLEKGSLVSEEWMKISWGEQAGSGGGLKDLLLQRFSKFSPAFFAIAADSR